MTQQLKDSNNLPLDLYTWRVLAFGRQYGYLLNVPEYDFRYRKVVEFKGHKVTGFYHSPDYDIDNLWIDGLGHMACAQISDADKNRGYFYANQLDLLLVDRYINGEHVRALPYTANKSGGFDWVSQDRGFTSTCAWYIFAKNGFNPYTLQKD